MNRYFMVNQKMTKDKRMTGFAASICGLCVLAPAPAFAYIDPGTGSLVIQSLIGGVVALLAFGRIYWAKIKEFFKKEATNPPTGDDEAAKENTQNN